MALKHVYYHVRIESPVYVQCRIQHAWEGQMDGESNMETYLTMCKIDSQRKFAGCLRELKQGLCINLE